ncbi:MAG: DinB family protein [Propionibacteriales bacterium]|nr:DinB family protein [Propionibacteriales bacterium]
MTPDFVSATDPIDSLGEVLLRYLDYFRGVVIEKVQGLDDETLRTSSLPSGWTPLELVKHLAYVELRWFVWGFEGEHIDDPWGDNRDGHWYVGPDESRELLVERLQLQGESTRRVVESHELTDVGAPGERWDGDDPAELERVLLHVLQEYARHAGHLDIVRELIDGAVGES